MTIQVIAPQKRGPNREGLTMSGNQDNRLLDRVLQHESLNFHFWDKIDDLNDDALDMLVSSLVHSNPTIYRVDIGRKLRTFRFDFANNELLAERDPPYLTSTQYVRFLTIIKSLPNLQILQLYGYNEPDDLLALSLFLTRHPTIEHLHVEEQSSIPQSVITAIGTMTLKSLRMGRVSEGVSLLPILNIHSLQFLQLETDDYDHPYNYNDINDYIRENDPAFNSYYELLTRIKNNNNELPNLSTIGVELYHSSWNGRLCEVLFDIVECKYPNITTLRIGYIDEEELFWDRFISAISINGHITGCWFKLIYIGDQHLELLVNLLKTNYTMMSIENVEVSMVDDSSTDSDSDIRRAKIEKLKTEMKYYLMLNRQGRSTILGEVDAKPEDVIAAMAQTDGPDDELDDIDSTNWLYFVLKQNLNLFNFSQQHHRQQDTSCSSAGQEQRHDSGPNTPRKKQRCV